MQPPTPPSDGQDPAQGLPTVVPPSGKHIVQLFVVPGLIVAGSVLLFLLATWLVSGSRTADKFIEGLESSNPEVRWRVAADLAQLLPRDDSLASDPELAVRLTELLRRRQEEYDSAVQDLAGRFSSLHDRELAQEQVGLKTRRHELQYLIASLGSMTLPTGAPQLAEIARREPAGSDLKSQTLLRRDAIWALAKLGENLKRFDQLPPQRREEVLAWLRQQAADGSADRRQLVRLTMDYLDGTHRALGVIAALADCARANDPSIRGMAAHALNFWEGDAAENALAEKVLLRLAQDDGHGQRVDIEPDD